MAIDVYLQIDGIKGESQDEAHKGWIECSSVNWSLTQPKSATSSTAGGHTAERVEFTEIGVNKTADLASPILAQHCAMGKTIPKAKLEFMPAADCRRGRRQYCRWLGPGGKPGGGMKKLAVAVVLALLAARAGAAPGYRAHMTGTQLVRDMLAEPGVGLNSIRRERATGYIDGVADASAGVRWCPAGKSVPHELPYVVIEEVAKMTAQLAGDASALVLAALARLYPCRPGAAP